MKKASIEVPTAVHAKRATEFPCWAPRGLCELYDREVACALALTATDCTLLKALLTRPEMENVWDKLKDVDKNRKENSPSGAPLVSAVEGFAMAAILAYRGPQGEESSAPGAQKKRLKAVRTKATELAELVKDTLWDDWLLKKWAASGVPPAEEGKLGSRNMPGKLSTFLEEFAACAAGQMRPSVLGRPKAEDAQELYFKRSLAGYCVCNLGASFDSTDIVNDVALLIYPRTGTKDDDLVAKRRTKEQVLNTPQAADDEEIRQILTDLQKTKKRKR